MREGWQERKLGELCDIQLGKTPARANSSFWDEQRSTGNVWLSIADLLNAEGHRVFDSKEYLSNEGAKLCKIVKKGTLLVSFKLTLGRLAFAGRDLYTNEAIAALTIHDETLLFREYLFYFLHFFDWVKAAEDDVKLKGMTLNKAKLKQIGVLFPPLPEQKRIVAILDEAFAGISTAVANTEKNLANARELFESYLNSVFSQRGEGWTETKLSEFIGISHGFAFKGPDFKTSSDSSKPIVLTPGNYTENAELDFSPKNTKRFYGQSPRGYIFNQGDLTVVMTDLSSKMKILGKPAFVNQPDVLHNQRIGRVILNTEDLDKRFLYYFLRTRYVSEEIKRTSTGTMVKHTAPKRILALKIPIPRLRCTQNEIASQLHFLSTEILKTEVIFQQKLTALAELKQSLLQKAFSGELTAEAPNEVKAALA